MDIAIQHLFTNTSIHTVVPAGCSILIISLVRLGGWQLGCFLMGWVGVALKKQIVNFNEPLAVGLSTGLCGSLTTFAAWNQMVLQMVDRGLWTRGLFTYFFGTDTHAHILLFFGMETDLHIFSVLGVPESSVKSLRYLPLPPSLRPHVVIPHM